VQVEERREVQMEERGQGEEEVEVVVIGGE
jgi:hypothetical protein